RTGIASLLNAQPDLEVVGEASDGLEAQYRAAALQPDLILMDINMPGVNGLEALDLILKDNPDSKIIMLTIHDDDEQVFNAIRNGAKGYILKNTNTETFLKMLYTALQDGAVLSAKHTGKVIAEFAKKPVAIPKVAEKVNLTNREKDVLILISQKQTDKQIAQALSISLHTVKSHVRNILAKLKVGNRRQAAEYAKQNKLFPTPTEN
ncbi:MAG: response regulator transcription factor, partial [Chloroflexota bacterium]